MNELHERDAGTQDPEEIDEMQIPIDADLGDGLAAPEGDPAKIVESDPEGRPTV